VAHHAGRALTPVGVAARPDEDRLDIATIEVEAPATVALTRVGEAVQVTENAASARECEYIAELPLRNRSVSDVNTMRTLQNDAGESGANLVLLVMETRTTIARAEGYLCAD
jgi:hypothetical protein